MKKGLSLIVIIAVLGMLVMWGVGVYNKIVGLES